ncbi:NTPase, partial [Escherichia coli]|nr:NTPase [Escherichia coli]
MKCGDCNWNWDEETTFILDDEEEILSKDKLNRRHYAEYLYFYLKEKGQKNNTVINLNAEWGAGKSFFIKRFYNSIKDAHPCVYIDAWKQDFSDDAFLTLFSSLSQQLQTYAGKLDARLIQS